MAWCVLSIPFIENFIFFSLICDSTFMIYQNPVYNYICFWKFSSVSLIFPHPLPLLKPVTLLSGFL